MTAVCSQDSEQASGVQKIKEAQWLANNYLYYILFLKTVLTKPIWSFQEKNYSEKFYLIRVPKAQLHIWTDILYLDTFFSKSNGISSVHFQQRITIENSKYL